MLKLDRPAGLSNHSEPVTLLCSFTARAGFIHARMPSLPSNPQGSESKVYHHELSPENKTQSPLGSHYHRPWLVSTELSEPLWVSDSPPLQMPIHQDNLQEPQRAVTTSPNLKSLWGGSERLRLSHDPPGPSPSVKSSQVLVLTSSPDPHQTDHPRPTPRSHEGFPGMGLGQDQGSYCGPATLAQDHWLDFHSTLTLQSWAVWLQLSVFPCTRPCKELATGLAVGTSREQRWTGSTTAHPAWLNLGRSALPPSSPLRSVPSSSRPPWIPGTSHKVGPLEEIPRACAHSRLPTGLSQRPAAQTSNAATRAPDQSHRCSTKEQLQPEPPMGAVQLAKRGQVSASPWGSQSPLPHTLCPLSCRDTECGAVCGDRCGCLEQRCVCTYHT